MNTNDNQRINHFAELEELWRDIDLITDYADFSDSEKYKMIEQRIDSFNENYRSWQSLSTIQGEEKETVEQAAFKEFPIRMERPEWRTAEEEYDANEADRNIWIAGANWKFSQEIEEHSDLTDLLEAWGHKVLTTGNNFGIGEFLKKNKLISQSSSDESTASSNEVDGWIKFEYRCKMPDYDEQVLWLRKDGNVFAACLDKDGNGWLEDFVAWRNIPAWPDELLK